MLINLSQTGYVCLDLDQIGEYVKLIPGKSVKAHAARIRRDIITELKTALTIGGEVIFYNVHNLELLKNRIIHNNYGPQEIEFKLKPEYNEAETMQLFKKEGLVEGGNIKLYELVQKGKFSVADAAEDMGVSEEEFINKMNLCGYHLSK